jgi:hypothetical protein
MKARDRMDGCMRRRITFRSCFSDTTTPWVLDIDLDYFMVMHTDWMREYTDFSILQKASDHWPMAAGD